MELMFDVLDVAQVGDAVFFLLVDGHIEQQSSSDWRRGFSSDCKFVGQQLGDILEGIEKVYKQTEDIYRRSEAKNKELVKWNAAHQLSMETDPPAKLEIKLRPLKWKSDQLVILFVLKNTTQVALGGSGWSLSVTLRTEKVGTAFQKGMYEIPPIVGRGRRSSTRNTYTYLEYSPLPLVAVMVVAVSLIISVLSAFSVYQNYSHFSFPLDQQAIPFGSTAIIAEEVVNLSMKSGWIIKPQLVFAPEDMDSFGHRLAPIVYSLDDVSIDVIDQLADTSNDVEVVPTFQGEGFLTTSIVLTSQKGMATSVDAKKIIKTRAHQPRKETETTISFQKSFCEQKQEVVFCFVWFCFGFSDLRAFSVGIHKSCSLTSDMV